MHKYRLEIVTNYSFISEGTEKCIYSGLHFICVHNTYLSEQSMTSNSLLSLSMQFISPYISHFIKNDHSVAFISHSGDEVISIS